jgi:hypothetical protein
VKLINERFVSVMGECVILGCFDVTELSNKDFLYILEVLFIMSTL